MRRRIAYELLRELKYGNVVTEYREFSFFRENCPDDGHQQLLPPPPPPPPLVPSR